MTKEEFLKRLNKLDLNLREFADIAGIPYSTVRNWGYKSNYDSKKEILIPSWVEPMLKYYNIASKVDSSLVPNKK